MKFLVEGILCGDCERDITDALLHIDLGARVKVDALIHHVGVAGRMTLEQACNAIEARGFRIASVLDQTLEDAVWSGARPASQFI